MHVSIGVDAECWKTWRWRHNSWWADDRESYLSVVVVTELAVNPAILVVVVEKVPLSIAVWGGTVTGPFPFPLPPAVAVVLFAVDEETNDVPVWMIAGPPAS